MRLCGHIVLDKLEKLNSVEEELIGGTLEEEVNYFEARLIAQALERQKGSVTRAARELGLSRQGLSRILKGRQNSTLGSQNKKRIAVDRNESHN